MMSHAGVATPPRTSIPSLALSFLAVPIQLNQGSCISIRLVLLMLFSRVWVTAFCLRIFTDTMWIGGCTAIRQGLLK